MSTIKKPIRVLLVDDHQTMLWGLVKLIESENPRMEVAGTARTCKEALLKIKQDCPDVVLLDLDLGGASAIDIIPEIHLSFSSRVLIFTGETDQKKLDMAVFHGARGILHKNVSAEQVLKAIEKIAEGKIWLDNERLGRVFSEIMEIKATGKINPELEKQESLTIRERKIVEAIVEGSGTLNKSLAQKLFISDHTLRNHVSSIYQKLGVNNRLELYVYALKHQMVASAAFVGSGQKF